MDGIEYWYARELQLVLDYKEWRKFEGAIQKAIKVCENDDINTPEDLPTPKKSLKQLEKENKKSLLKQ